MLAYLSDDAFDNFSCVFRLRCSDAYCFELLSMVLALSGSAVGRQYLAQQHTLMLDLLTLLHTASPRVQRQVTSLLRRVLPEVLPHVLAKLLGVPALPTTDLGALSSRNRQDEAPFDARRLGILDVLLACVAKSLTLQLKTRGSRSSAGGKGRNVPSSYTSAQCLDASSDLDSRWWLRGVTSSQLANSIIELLKDLSSGKLSEQWSAVAKAAVAENILVLTRMDESLRSADACVKTPTVSNGT